MPGLIMGKQEYARPDRPQAGMLFYNDHGDENGGLIFSGGLVNGKANNGGSLTFDRYHQDQTLQLLSVRTARTGSRACMSMINLICPLRTTVYRR